jgi:hypothetical protein
MGEQTVQNTPSNAKIDFSRIKIHSKFKEIQPDDANEQEAETFIEKLIPISEAGLQWLAETEENGIQEEKQKAQVQTEDQVISSSPPLIFNGRLNPSGQPLDAEVRRTMEQRFRHDFSRVRVHTDAQAAASARNLHALAYTMGEDIVFGPGKYQPQSFLGRALIAHELAHTIQQRWASSTMISNNKLEDVADEAASNILLDQNVYIPPVIAAPTIQFLKVSEGGFSQALEEHTNIFGIPDKIIRLLQKSKKFKALAEKLDKNYVSHDDVSQYRPEFSPDGYIVSGKAKKMPKSMIGKRSLKIAGGDPGFFPIYSPDNSLEADVITTGGLVGGIPHFIARLAHEATHASNFIGAAAPPVQTLQAELEAGIQEEIKTRESEAMILGEIAKEAKIPGEIPEADVKAIQARAKEVGSTDPAVVERDIPESFMLTYLELFFFNRELRKAQADEGLTIEQVAEIQREVDKAMKLNLLYPFGGEYGRVLTNRWIAQQEWREFLQRHQKTDPDFEQRKEDLLQNHAKTFFQGLISYKPLRSITPTP